MSAVVVLRLPLDTDLSGFLALLQRLQVPCRVSEERGGQVLWVPEALAEQVRDLYERYPNGDPDAPIEGELVAREPERRFGSLRAAPLTALTRLLTVLVFAITWGGESLEAIRWLSFTDFGNAPAVSRALQAKGFATEPGVARSTTYTISGRNPTATKAAKVEAAARSGF